MSESEAHRRLVRDTAVRVAKGFGAVRIVTDVQDAPGGPTPPLIDGHRPDLWGTDATGRTILIGEAKTPRDLQRRHTVRQLRSFLGYLENQGRGCFVLAVEGHGAVFAKTLLRFFAQEACAMATRLVVFDGFDLWTLHQQSGVRWRLH